MRLEMLTKHKKFSVLKTYLEAFPQRVHADAEKNLPCLLFCPHLRPNFEQPFVQVNSQAGQHLFLGNVNGLCVPFSSTETTLGNNVEKFLFDLSHLTSGLKKLF